MPALAALSSSLPAFLVRTLQMSADWKALRALDEKLRVVLPPAYAAYEDVQPVSMGTAALKYDAEGNVAWDDIWGSFCDLAMAGGPPHKGKLLEPATAGEIAAEPQRYHDVVHEICRGIRMVTPSVTVQPSPNAGWISVTCPTPVMAAWIARAIVMENVSATVHGRVVELPAGPHYRLQKEIKNVITVMAKTAHYFEGHIGPRQRQKIAALFAEAEAHAPLLQPVIDASVIPLDCKIKALAQLGVNSAGTLYNGWLGLEIGRVRTAIWMMRALVISNVMARREDTILYLPVNPLADPDAQRLVAAVKHVQRLAQTRGLLP